MKKRYLSMSEVLKRAIEESGASLNAIERETGVQRASIIRFLRGETSLRLDIADKLAEHFGVTVVPPKDK